MDDLDMKKLKEAGRMIVGTGLVVAAASLVFFAMPIIAGGFMMWLTGSSGFAAFGSLVGFGFGAGAAAGGINFLLES